ARDRHRERVPHLSAGVDAAARRRGGGAYRRDGDAAWLRAAPPPPVPPRLQPRIGGIGWLDRDGVPRRGDPGRLSWHGNLGPAFFAGNRGDLGGDPGRLGGVARNGGAR